MTPKTWGGHTPSYLYKKELSHGGGIEWDGMEWGRIEQTRIE